MITLHDIKSLLEREDEQIVTLYLQVDNALEENQADTPAWRIWLKNALRDTENTIPDDQRDVWEARKKRIDNIIANYVPESKSLVMFIGDDFEQTYELPVLVNENAISYGEVMVSPALWLIDEYEPYLIVLVDTEKAHFMTTYLGNTEENDTLESDRFDYDFVEKTLMPRNSTSVEYAGSQVTQGSNRDSFDDMIQEKIDTFYRRVADHAQEMMASNKAQRLILGGTERSYHAVRDMLHQSVAERVVDALPIPLDSSDQDVMQRILPAAMNYERSQEYDLVEQVVGMAKSDGRGALGQNAIEDALTQQRVELLIAPFPSEMPDIVEHLTVQTIEKGGEVELVHGSAASLLEREGGVAARLYYTI